MERDEDILTTTIEAKTMDYSNRLPPRARVVILIAVMGCRVSYRLGVSHSGSSRLHAVHWRVRETASCLQSSWKDMRGLAAIKLQICNLRPTILS